MCSIRSAACNHRQVQSKTNYTEKSFWWYLILLTVFGDTEITLGIEINIFFSIYNITYYSQHVINLKVCLNTGRCAVAPHWERCLTPTHSPCYSSAWRKKQITGFFSFYFFFLSFFHKTSSPLSFPPFFSTDCICYLNSTKTPRMGEETHPAVGLPQTKSLVYSHHECVVHTPHMLQKTISFGNGNAAFVSKCCCAGVSEPFSLGQGFLSHGYSASLTPANISVWVPTRLSFTGNFHHNLCWYANVLSDHNIWYMYVFTNVSMYT